jgi:oligosaccharide repeat unit polymerase
MIFLPFIYFSLLLLVHYIRTKTFNLGTLLLVLYSFSALISIILYKTDFLFYQHIEIKLSSCIYYCGMLTMFFAPFLTNRHTKIEKTSLPNLKLFNLISYFFIIINITAIVLTLNYTVFILSHDAGAFKTDSKLLMRLGYNIGFFETIGISIFQYFSDFYIVNLIFFFYSITYLKKNLIFNSLLLISSMSTIVNGLSVGGRTQMIYWILVFISIYLFFKNQMSQSTKRFVSKTFFVLLSIFSVYFIGITISRFSGAYSSATNYHELISIAEYSGQSFLRFNEFFTSFHYDDYTLARIFPILHDIFSSSKFDLSKYRQMLPMNIGIFYTFLGDLFVDVGVMGTIIYLIVYRSMFSLTQKKYKNNTIRFHKVLLLFMFYQIPLNGLFYYSLWNKLATISVIGTIIFSLIFKIAKNYK